MDFKLKTKQKGQGQIIAEILATTLVLLAIFLPAFVLADNTTGLPCTGDLICGTGFYCQTNTNSSFHDKCIVIPTKATACTYGDNGDPCISAKTGLSCGTGGFCTDGSTSGNPPATTNPGSPAQTTGSSPTCPDKTSLVNGLCLPTTPAFGTTGLAGQKTLSGLILQIIQLLLTFAGMIAVGALVLGGYWYITSAGNEEQAEKGKKAIINAIIGLVIITLAYAIVMIISSTLLATNYA